MTAPCLYLTAPQEMLESKRFGEGWRPVENPDRFLCAWATYHADAVAALSKAPPWLVSNALSGHLVRADKDCPRCPYYQAGDPIE